MSARAKVGLVLGDDGEPGLQPDLGARPRSDQGRCPRCERLLAASPRTHLVERCQGQGGVTFVVRTRVCDRCAAALLGHGRAEWIAWNGLEEDEP